MKQTEQHEGLARLLRPRDAAEFLAVSPRKLWELTNAGLVPSLRIGRSVRYDPRDLLEWVEKQKPRRRAQ